MDNSNFTGLIGIASDFTLTRGVWPDTVEDIRERYTFGHDCKDWTYFIHRARHHKVYTCPGCGTIFALWMNEINDRERALTIRVSPETKATLEPLGTLRERAQEYSSTGSDNG